MGTHPLYVILQDFTTEGLPTCLSLLPNRISNDGQENGDLCAYQYGKLATTNQNKVYNILLGPSQRPFIIQTIWNPNLPGIPSQANNCVMSPKSESWLQLGHCVRKKKANQSSNLSAIKFLRLRAVSLCRVRSKVLIYLHSLYFYVAQYKAKSSCHFQPAQMQTASANRHN